MIKLYGNNCVMCMQLQEILTCNNIKFKYYNISHYTLDEIKSMLKSDYEPGLVFPLVYENNVLIKNIHAFARRINKNDK